MIARASLAAGLIATLTGASVAQRPAPGAQIDLAGFRYERDLPAGAGLTSITLDAAALAHAHLNDIRIVDEQRRQIPYVLDRADSAVVIALEAPKPVKPAASIDPRLPSDADKRTWYRLKLPLAGLPDATIVLETSAKVFRREIIVVEGAATDATYRRTTTAYWSHEDPATAAPSLSVALASRTPGDSLFLLVNDGDNDKLPITKATLRVPTYSLRFFRDSASTLRMVYGRADLPAPSYDLAIVAARLKDSAAAVVVPGAERSIADPAARVPTVVFWSLLVAVVLIMLLLIARLLRGGAEPAGAESVQG